MVLGVTALQADAFHLPHSWTARHRLLFGHLTAARPALFALPKVRFRYRDRLPAIHSIDPKVIGRKKPPRLHQAVEVVLSVLPDLLAIT
jgi:hypothetical protein